MKGSQQACSPFGDVTRSHMQLTCEWKEVWERESGKEWSACNNLCLNIFHFHPELQSRINFVSNKKCYSLLPLPSLTHPPGNFAKKKHFEASRAVFWSLSCYKELKLTIKPFTGHTLRSLLIQMQNTSFQSLGMCRKQNLETGFGF